MDPPDAAHFAQAPGRAASGGLPATLLDVVGLPLLLAAWMLLAFPGSELGPVRVTAALALTLPSMLVWGTAHRPCGSGLRIAAVLGATGALLAAHPAAAMPALPAGIAAVLSAGSLLLLIPAAAEWYRRLAPVPRDGAAARWIFDAISAVVLPLAIFFAMPIQRFPAPAWVDAGIYLGLALDYFDIVRSYGWSYHALRVSSVIPNVLANAILPPVEARYAVTTGFLLASTIGLYTGARLLWGRLPALVATVLLASNPVFLLALTAGYVDGAVVAYALLLFAALSAWRREGRLCWVVAAGALCALIVLAHTIAALTAALFILFFAILEWPRLVSRPVSIAAAGLFGAALVWFYFVYALSGVGFGVSAFHVLNWIVQASVTGGMGARYQLPVGDWLPATTRLIPAILFLLILVALAAGAKLRRLDAAVLALGASAAATLPVYDLLLQGSTTQSAFYAGLVLPGTAVASAAVANLTISRHQRSRMLIAILVSAASLLPSVLIRQFPQMSEKGHIGFASLLAASIVLALLGLAMRRSGQGARNALLFGVVLVTGLSYVRNADTQVAYRTPETVSNAEFFDASVFVRDALVREAAGRTPLFWFERAAFRDAQGRLDRFTRPIRYGDTVMPLTPFDGLASLRLWDRSLFAPTIASGADFERARLLKQPNATLIVMDNGEGQIERAVRILEEERVGCELRYVGLHRSASFYLRIAMLDVLSEGTAPSPRCREDGRLGISRIAY